MYVKYLLKSSCIAISISTLFIGCGGGGGSSTSSNNTTPTVKIKAYLIDSAVAGAKYVNSDGSTGFTSSDGSFDYVNGTTSFYIGNIKIGEVSSLNADRKVFIQDLVGVPRGNINHPKVLKIATFLQSIDSDLNTDEIEIADNFDKFADINDNIENVDLSTLLTNKNFNQKNQDNVKSHLESVLNSNNIRVDKTAPQIVSTTIKPSIKVSDSLVVAFSEELDRDSINTQNIQLKKVSDNSIVDVRINYYNNTNSIEIDPISNLEYDESYALTISSNVKDSGSIALSQEKIYQFKTALVPDDTKPAVNIIGEASKILLDATLRFQFSEKIEQNSLNSNSVILKDEGNLPVSSTLSYDPTSNILSIKANENLKPSKTYTIKLTDKIEDLASNTLDEFNLEFTTLDEINATPLSVSSTSLSSQNTISKNSNINIEFSKEIDTRTLSENIVIQEAGKNYSISSEITVNGNTVTLNPVNDLKDDTSYELIIKTGLKDSFGNNFLVEEKITFKTQAIVDNTAPLLIDNQTSIQNEAKNVSLDTTFSFTFNENMDETSINNGITLKTIDDVNVPITISYLNKTVTVSPNANLDYSKVYKLTLKASIQDLAGNKYDGEPYLVGLADKVISFTTISDPSDNQEPQLVTASNLGVVSKDSKIIIEFNEEIKEITSSNYTTFLDIPFGYSFESYSNKVITLATTNNNEYNKKYEITLKTSIEDLAGNSLSSDKTVSFKTQEEADTTAPKLLSSIPIDKVESVPVDSTIKLNFDENLEQTSININNIKLVKANEENTNLIISAELSYSDKTISINPNSDLDLNTDYIVIVLKDGIKDLNNNLFEGNFGNDLRISFKTQTSTSSCQNGYTQYENSCYKVLSEDKTYEDAKLTCQNDSATLVSKELFFDSEYLEYKSQLVNNFASALSLSTDYIYWLKEEDTNQAYSIKKSFFNGWSAPSTQLKTQTNYSICTK